MITHVIDEGLCLGEVDDHDFWTRLWVVYDSQLLDGCLRQLNDEEAAWNLDSKRSKFGEEICGDIVISFHVRKHEPYYNAIWKKINMNR